MFVVGQDEGEGGTRTRHFDDYHADERDVHGQGYLLSSESQRGNAVLFCCLDIMTASCEITDRPAPARSRLSGLHLSALQS